ncbi:hypothetical protein PTSG_07269 [Salpingoeca rosetta]|uniref:Uncharacterized protein n=1 Tax=Salpingoeca rosetta (strain ATCC 50818 / BSB-021) TaxID=946362 RepID=F2UIY0_SALR5|nr:uncharacterized protein PTSG_07269 [Salpingoeca rosetta]EGD76928.1 hypothetical protein PTSG_07269 [Salpingoeca rosetta]|eukprot:XP_004990768.1 hypothetical protein PTSG_07269 [Salpingoeca rosetta]
MVLALAGERQVDAATPCSARGAVPSGPNRCLCPEERPKCIGLCASGVHKTTGKVVHGFRTTCEECECVVDSEADTESTSKPVVVEWDAPRQDEQQPRPVASSSKTQHDQTSSFHGPDDGEYPADYAAKLAAKSEIDFEPIAARLRGDTSLDMRDARYWDDGIVKPRLLVMTVATHREPFIELTEQSVGNIGKKLLVAGEGEFFKGYGWKLKKVRETLLKYKDDYDMVLFTDSFDSFVFAEEDELIDTFRSMNAPMVVSAEVNCWPNPELATEMPPSSSVGHYPYPNSGGYMGYLGYILHLYNDVIAIHHKSDCCDDQGELIKAVVLDNKAFRIDHQAVLFQTLFGSAKRDVVVRDGRIHNQATHTSPAVVHANGWDKGPLLDILQQAGELTPQYRQQLLDLKATLEKQKTLEKRENAVNQRCEDHNPNPSMDPERNFIKEYGLMPLSKLRRKQLKQEKNVTWHQIEQQVYEVQEFRTHCPETPLHYRTANGGPDVSDDRTASIDPLRTCSSFKVYVYPLTTDEEAALPAIYRAIRTAIRDGPYSTDDPSKACLFVPSTDVSCWCEDCMHGTYSGNIESMHPVSAAIERNLSRLAYWNEGRNHILFEYSDAPCLPWHAEHAIVAKVGLSEFHHRDGLDVSMPLFSMVTFTPEQRRVPPANRKYLVTFRGTKSARSDAMRNHLPKLHNGRDIVLVCACRWFGEERMGREGKVGYDPSCKQAEEEFNKYTYTELALETKFGLIIMAAGAIPVIVVDHYVLVRLPRILRSIRDEVVEMMQRRVVFVFEEFFKSLSTQVHTALESARINLFSGDNAWYLKGKMQVEGLAYDTPNETPHDVMQESVWCNTPAHRRKAAKDNAPM